MAPAPSYRVRAFQSPKAGASLESCQDALRLRGADPLGPDRTLATRGLRAALADGATCSAFPGEWAQLLTLAAVGMGVPMTRTAAFRTRLERLAALWRQVVSDGLPAERPWFVDQGLARGAFSTLLRFSLGPDAWEAEAVGDTCLFQVRDGGLKTAFPLERPEEFDRPPVLLATDAARNGRLAGSVRAARGGVRSGDAFLLATDAVARWILARRGWADLLDLAEGSQADWAAWLQANRSGGHLQDDDSTLLLVRVP